MNPDITYAHMDAPIGAVWVASTNKGICAVGLGSEQPETMLDRLARCCEFESIRQDPQPLESALVQLCEYFSRIRREFDLPLDIVYGTPFQKSVWQAVVGIPYGVTATYGEIARNVEQPHAARAVGAALGANLLPIIIPCHRVIGVRDKLTGYNAGIEIKASLLRLEGVLLS
jgi:O-6-methylguanine DNA methyltransferase